MLIGIDASRANREFKGGTEWYSYYLIRELAKIDAKNQYILYSDKPLSVDLADLTGGTGGVVKKSEISRGGWQKIKSPNNNFKAKILHWPFIYFWTQIRLSYEMLVHRPDVLFIPAHTLPLIHPKKSVVTIHDIGFERRAGLYSSDKIVSAGGFISGLLNFLTKLFTRGKFQPNVLNYHSWSTRYALEHAEIIIAVSEFTKREMVEFYQAAADKIKVVYNGFNGELYRPIGDEEKIKEVLSKYDIISPYIFYAGRLEKKKNTAKLVEAYAVMREKHKEIKHKLVLAGAAGLGFDEVKDVINEYDLQEEIIITGWIPEADLPYVFNGAALFVFPSLYEGFGIPLIEAMASGVPIAAAKVASIPEVVKDSARLFDPENRDEIAEKMSEILLDKKLAGELISRGFSRVKDFSLNKCAKETLALLEKIKT